MAAIATVMELFQPGDHLIVDADLYGGTIRLFNHISEKNGISITPVNCSKDDVKAYIRENTKAVFIETWLLEQKEVTKVLYPGLKEHPGYGMKPRSGIPMTSIEIGFDGT